MSEKFNYVYTAPTEEERKEICSIRRQYEEGEKKEESKIEKLRRLDKKVKNTATCWGVSLGVVGILTFGLGLTMVLEWDLWFWGILIAAVGGVGIALAYPIYQWVLKRNKKRYGEEILRLSKELLAEK